ncbi:uncharacterized protein LOC117121575 [Anneissia japonica]|uniref:uncharacterized protein LOC117121575 n=1 Tax=Anneissia japonica TaxID=1529436 RepID=UPI0014255ED7|nr:uncharacterized protein LOC117121575 [Anneissia japonica]
MIGCFWAGDSNNLQKTEVLMAESIGLSKAAKKNQKRRGNKDPSLLRQNVEGSADLIQDIRDQLAKAKANKDHSLANELRQKLWIAQDLNAGYKPAIDKDDHNAQKLLSKVTEGRLEVSKTTEPVPAPVTSTLDEDERKLRNLQKKLKKIEELKKKKEAGEKLQDNQLKKIEMEAELLEEIQHLQKLMSIPVKT